MEKLGQGKNYRSMIQNGNIPGDYLCIMSCFVLDALLNGLLLKYLLLILILVTYYFHIQTQIPRKNTWNYPTVFFSCPLNSLGRPLK